MIGTDYILTNISIIMIFRFDVTETQLLIIGVYMMNFLFGASVWDLTVSKDKYRIYSELQCGTLQ